VPEPPVPIPDVPPIDLKDPATAGFLAWLVPGLGHYYQGRYAKAALFSVCILGTFLFGLYLSSNSDIGWGRAVYFSLRQGRNRQGDYENDLRLAYVCQIGAGAPALPALLQAAWDPTGRQPLLGGFEAPPQLEENDQRQLVPMMLYRHKHRSLELGTVYTMIAGLLNILAVYDACCGPVPPEPPKRKEDEDEKKPDEAEEKK
jgi:hypothetical protein